MRYCTLFLFCLLFTASAFGQSDSIQLLPTRIVTTDSTHSLKWENVTLPNSAMACLIGDPISPPIIKPCISFATITHENFSLLGGLPINAFRFQNVNQIANTQAGVFSVDGETPSILGARTEGTAYYINGVRVLEGFLPQLIE